MLYKVQVGAFSVKENAEKLLAKLKADGYEGFIVAVDDGNDAPAPAPTPDPAPSIKVGSIVRVKKGAKDYNGNSLADFIYNRDHKVHELKGNRAVIAYGDVIVAAVRLEDLYLV